MLVDTTTHVSNYDKKFKSIYFKNHLLLRKDFCNWVDRIGKADDLDWWISIPASRNYNYSNLYHYFCLVESFKKIKKNYITKLIVDNEDVKNILKKDLKFNTQIHVKRVSKNLFFQDLKLIIKHFIFHIVIFIFSNLGKKNKISSKSDLVLIDTFLESKNINSNRFYSDHLLREVHKKDNIFFVPSFYVGMGLLNVIKNIISCKNSKNFLLKERYLKFNDILKSLFLIFRRTKFKKKYIKLKKIDYTKFINKELNLNKNLSSQITGWQNFLFFKNIKNSKIKIKKTINWFENQSLDKGWNLGVRTFFPKAKCFGYQGFTCFPQYMCLNPTKSEYSAKVVPEVILSIGKIFNKTKKEFYKKIKVKTVPALNFQYLYIKKIKKINKIKKSILIILSGFLQDDISLLKWIIKSKIHEKKYKIFIKEHPILKINKIKRYFDFFPSRFIVTEKNFLDSVNMSETLICSGATSALTELVVTGKYCIIPKINPHDGLTFKKLKIKDNFLILDDPLKLIESLRQFKTVFYNKNDFFTKLSKKNVKVFL